MKNNNPLKISTALALALTLSFGLSGCGIANNPTDNSLMPAPAQTQDNRPRLESEHLLHTQDSLNIKTVNEIFANNESKPFIKVSDEGQINFESIGIIEENTEGQIAADGEKLYAINYINSSDKEVSINYELDGTTKKFELDQDSFLKDKGTIIISAPENITIKLNLENENLIQSIDFKTGERLSAGVADIWYSGKTIGKFENNINESTLKTKKGYKITLTENYKEVTKTPYNPHADEGQRWADAGKSAWVIIDVKDSVYDLSSMKNKEPNAEVGTNETTEAILSDSKGSEYKGKAFNDGILSDESSLVFKVPAEESDYEIHSKRSFDIDSWGSTIDSVTNASGNKNKISF